jgi:hypothetical protein
MMLVIIEAVSTNRRIAQVKSGLRRQSQWTLDTYLTKQGVEVVCVVQVWSCWTVESFGTGATRALVALKVAFLSALLTLCRQLQPSMMPNELMDEGKAPSYPLPPAAPFSHGGQSLVDDSLERDTNFSRIKLVPLDQMGTPHRQSSSLIL